MGLASHPQQVSGCCPRGGGAGRSEGPQEQVSAGPCSRKDVTPTPLPGGTGVANRPEAPRRGVPAPSTATPQPLQPSAWILLSLTSGPGCIPAPPPGFKSLTGLSLVALGIWLLPPVSIDAFLVVALPFKLGIRRGLLRLHGRFCLLQLHLEQPQDGRINQVIAGTNPDRLPSWPRGPPIPSWSQTPPSQSHSRPHTGITGGFLPKSCSQTAPSMN